MENFDFSKLRNLNFEKQKEYITKYFIPLSNGSHCMLNNGVYELTPDEVVKKVYFNRFDKKLINYYFQEHTDIKTPVYELNKPLFFNNNINLCQQMPEHKPYKDFENSIKTKANIFLEFMFEVLCNKDKATQAHLNKWISNMCKGNKNDCAVILKTGAEGVGKSTLPKMIMEHMLGDKLTLETGSEPIKSKFNSILGGKLFVVFEELETFSTSEWLAVDCVLKRQITSNIINLQKKGQDAFEAKNINNYMLLSNHDMSDSGRRYFVLDVQTHRKGDRKYWSNIYDNCFNNEVGSCLYSYFREIDTTNFHPQDFPITKNKINSISKRLDPTYQFIKEEFILTNTDINLKLKDLYEMYKAYCAKINRKVCNKTDFTTKLSEVQINYQLYHGYNYYRIKLNVLKQIAEQLHWINELDEYDKDDDYNDDLTTPIKENIQQNELLKKLEELEKQNKELLEENNKLKLKKKIKKEKNETKPLTEDEEDAIMYEKWLNGEK